MGLVPTGRRGRPGGTEVQPSHILTTSKSPDSHNHTDSLSDFQETFLLNSTPLRRRM